MAMGADAEGKEATLVASGYTGKTTINNFQALVKLSDGDDYGFSYAEAAADGSDLWFEDADGNVIPHEIDTWDTSGSSFVWVRIPQLSGTNTKITMHWGDAAEKKTTGQNTWYGFAGVWHMNATGTESEPDAAANGLAAVPYITSGTANISRDANGMVGAGRKNVQNANLKVSSYANLITQPAQFSVSGWFKMSTADTFPRIFAGHPNTSDRTYWELWRENAATLKATGNGSSKAPSWSVNLSDGWHYLTLVYNNTSATLFDNGVSKNSGTVNTPRHSTFFSIGGIGTTASRSFVGTFDEVRMYNGVMTGDRVAADYKTMTAPTTFLTLNADVIVLRAEWTGLANDGDVGNPANWNCYDQSDNLAEGQLPTMATSVTVSGENLDFQMPKGSELKYSTLVFGDCTLGKDNDWCGLNTVETAAGSTINLHGCSLRIKGLSGNGLIVNTVNGEPGTGELVFYEDSGSTAQRVGATIDATVMTAKEGDGVLSDTCLGPAKTKSAEYYHRAGTIRFSPSTSDYLDLGPTLYSISGGTLANSSGNLQIGRERASAFVQTGGNVQPASGIFIGVRAHGSYRISDGSLSTSSNIYIGHGENSLGELYIDGGIVEAGAIEAGRVAAKSEGRIIQNSGRLSLNGNLTIGNNAGATGSYRISGGVANVKGSFLVGEAGSGTLDICGAAEITASGGISVGHDANGSGSVILSNGGKIVTTQISHSGSGGTAAVAINGGVLQAAKSGSILDNLSDVTIGEDGLTIIAGECDVAITASTLKAMPGKTAVVVEGQGSLDLSEATIEFVSALNDSFTFAKATDGRIVGIPALKGADGVSVSGWAAVVIDGNTCRIKRIGTVITLM